MNAPIIQWAKEPWLGDAEKKQQDEAEYGKPLNVSLEDQKAQFKSDFYWFNDNQDIEANENLDIEEDFPLTPILIWLLQQWHIDMNWFDESIDEMKKMPLDLHYVIIEDVIDWIWTLDIKEKQKLAKSLETKELVNEENFEKTEYYKDFSTSESINMSDPTDLNFMLAANYLKIPDNKWNELKNEKNLELTINIVLNKIINKQSREFRNNNSDLIFEIRKSKDTDDKYLKLNKLFNLSKQKDARWLWKKSKEFRDKQKWEKLEKLSLSERLNILKLEIEIAKDELDHKKLENLLEEAEQLKDESEESVWEVFVSGELDIIIQDLNVVLLEEKEEA